MADYWTYSGRDRSSTDGGYTREPGRGGSGSYTDNPTDSGNTDTGNTGNTGGTDTGTGGTQPTTIQAIENLWLQWWKEYYGTAYTGGTGSAFWKHLDPIRQVHESILLHVLAVLESRETVNSEAGPSNFVTFGYLFFRKVGEGKPVVEARAEAIAEIKSDPVLNPGYTDQTGNPQNPEEKKNYTWLIVAAITILVFLLRK